MSETKSSRDAAPPLARGLRSTVDEAAVRRMWAGIERRLPGGSEAQPVRAAWLAFAALLVAVSVWIATSRFASWQDGAAPRALVLEDGRSFDSLDSGVARFADGSRIEAEPGARVEALASTPGELSLLVRRGRARFVVTPGGPRRWSIDARGVRVEVVGTVLSVEASEHAVRVAVEVGAVLVRSPRLPDGVQRLAAGQHVELELEAPLPGPAPAEASAEAAPAPSASAIPERSPARARKRPQRAEKPAAGAPASPESARELWARADAARASGEPALAIELLDRLLRDHPGDAQAPLGAFTLGTVLAEQQEPERAVQAFRRALELGLPSVLRDLCLRRLQELAREQAPRGAVAVPR